MFFSQSITDIITNISDLYLNPPTVHLLSLQQLNCVLLTHLCELLRMSKDERLMKCTGLCHAVDISHLIKWWGLTECSFFCEVKWRQPTGRFVLFMPLKKLSISRMRQQRAELWNAMTVVMALSGLLSRMAGGEGMQSSTRKSTAGAVKFRHADRQTPSAFLVCGVHIYGLLYMCGFWNDAHVLSSGPRGRHTLQQDTSKLWSGMTILRADLEWSG